MSNVSSNGWIGALLLRKEDAGRVGYRVADLIEFQRNAREYGPELDAQDHIVRNCLILPRQTSDLEMTVDALRAFGGTQWRVAVLRNDLSDPPIPLTLQLPAASAAAAAACKEILIFDYDGIAAQAPISVVPVEGGTIAGQPRAYISTAFGSLRLVPFVFAALEKMQDRWCIS